MGIELKIVKCACGRIPESHSGKAITLFWVMCSKARCWFGPRRKTKSGAIKAWNRVMDCLDIAEGIADGRYGLAP